MTKSDLYNQIASLASHIEFDYNGKSGLIDPINKDEIHLAYNTYSDDVIEKALSLPEVMQEPLFDGKCLNDICEDIEFSW
ncbi:hypothetical protein FACS1894105_13140 [Clostridia bacterium]|nr:hypothetical protein FACS1894105_13140 [Clostridia bacterium]